MTKMRLLEAVLLCPLLLALLTFGQVQAQTKTVSGTVRDDKGAPVQGATIIVKGGKKGTTSDAQGAFSITLPSSVSSILVSYVGFETQEVNARSGKPLNITFSAVKTSLDEVVVVGYGTQKRRDLTGSVGSVKGDAVKDLPVTNVNEALQGRIAGVEVIKNSGAPDATASIIIRGESSLNQPPPLYIVDGVRQSGVTVNGMTSSGGDNFNVNDIASIDVLKDASAASIYGSAAAGGVIIITTKRGLGGSPVVHFDARYGVTKPELVHLLDKDGFIKMENIVQPGFFAGATELDTLPNTDWVHQLYRNATEQNYDVSVSGASPSVSYLFSGFYNAQKGILLNNRSNIGGARINTDYKLGNFIKVGEQLFVTQRLTDPPIGANASVYNAPFRSQPIIPIKNPDGTWGIEPVGYPGLAFGGPNPVGSIETVNAQNVINNLQGNVYLDVKLPLHLDFRTTLGYTYNQQNDDYFQNAYSFGIVASPESMLQKFSSTIGQVLNNYVLTYDQHFGRHSLNAVAGYEQITSSINNINATQSYVGIPGYSFIPTSESTPNVAGEYDPNGLIKSEFGRLNYNYNNRYYLSLSIRQDANYTVFGPSKQSGVFPAGSVGWNIGDEPFFKQTLPIFNALKLRGSYGSLGNSNVGNYSFVPTYSQFQALGNGSAGGQNFAPGAPLVIANSIDFLANSNLHWETVDETNLGIDGELLNHHIYFTVEWYNKVTKDMLYALPLPLSSGITSPFQTNIGVVQNRGVDLLLGYSNKIGKLGYDVSVTGGFNKNLVKNLDGIATDALYDGENFYTNGNTSYGIMSGQPVTITQAGLPFGEFYGYKSMGLFKTNAEAAASGQVTNGIAAEAGDIHFYHNPKNGSSLNSADEQVLGNPNPKLVYGINIRLNWKGFDLAALFNGIAGVQLFNGVKAYEEFPFSDGNTTSKVFGDSYFGTNQLTSQPRLGIVNPNGSFTLDPNKNYQTVSSYYVENGGYIKLKNLQVGYTFSSNALNKISVRSARVFVMANNLFKITKYSGLDPELGSGPSTNGFNGVTTRGIDGVNQYPQAKIFSGGFDFTF